MMIMAVALRRSEAGWHIITEEKNSRFRNTYDLFSGAGYRGRSPIHRIPCFKSYIRRHFFILF
jgi:hypothetical protein